MDPYMISLFTGLMGMAVGFLVAGVIIAIAVAVLDIVGMWHVFKKAGAPGWRSLVPVYDMVTVCKIAGINPWWSAAIVAPYLIGIIAPEDSPMMNTISILASLCGIGVSSYVMYRLAKSFGKGVGFAVGLVLLRPIFMMILGFGKDAYLGPYGTNFASRASSAPNAPNGTNTPSIPNGTETPNSPGASPASGSSSSNSQSSGGNFMSND